MKPPVCRLCKNAHWPRERHVWPAVPEVPHSNAPTPSRRSLGREPAAHSQRSAQTIAVENCDQSTTVSQGKPDTAPSELRSMTDADLKVRYNAVMAEVMRRRRAKQKERT
jgi:hypothetical protein